MWYRIWILLKARNKEFFRDRSSFGWNLAFPFLIIIGFSLIFTNDKQALYKVGVLTSKHLSYSESTSPSPVKQFENFKKMTFIDFIAFQSRQQALQKLKHHRIDLLIDLNTKQYWVSDSSPNGNVVEKLFQSSLYENNTGFAKQSITGQEIPYIEWLFPGILGMNMMFSALFGVGYVVVRYRKNGALKRLSVTPLKPYEFLTAQVISRIYILFFTTLIVFIGCKFIFGFRCQGSYINLLLIFLLGSFSMIALGLIVASRSSSEEFAGGILNLITWPMMFLSEVWFSLEGAQSWVQQLSKFFPLTHLIDGARKIMNDGATLFDIRYHVIILTAMSICFLAIGSILFKWHKT